MKKIIWSVILTHISLVGLAALWIPSKKIVNIPLKIRTISQQKSPVPSIQKILPSPQNEIIQTESQKTKNDVMNTTNAKNIPEKSAAPKKNTQLAKNTSKKNQVPTYLINQLQESIAKIEQNRHKEVPSGKLTIPSSFFKIESLENDEGDAFTTTLVDCFKKELHLPEVGEVKIALTLRQDGSLVDLKLLSKESQCNAQFLEKALHAMRFPAFNGELAKQKEHTFVITFCNR